MRELRGVLYRSRPTDSGWMSPELFDAVERATPLGDLGFPAEQRGTTVAAEAFLAAVVGLPYTSLSFPRDDPKRAKCGVRVRSGSGAVRFAGAGSLRSAAARFASASC
jgi:hypothetical protein